MARTIRNDRSGEVINVTMTDAEAAKAFAEQFGNRDHWLWFWVHKYALSVKKGEVKHAKSLAFLADLFMVAIGYGLKRPMIRAHFKDQRFKFYLSRKGTVCLKSGYLAVDQNAPLGSPASWTHDPVGDEFYVGCLVDGQFKPPYFGTPREMTATEKEFLAKLEQDPVGFLAQCSKDMNRCSYCNKPLEDERSMQVGYGSTCAAHWGLPWGDKSYVEKAPSFAKCWDLEIAHGILEGIRKDPSNKDAWLIFADWLEEHHMPRCKVPEKSVIVPRS